MRVSPNLASLIFGGAEQNRIPNSGHSRTRESSTDSAKRKSVRKACHHRHLGGLVGKTVWRCEGGREERGAISAAKSERFMTFERRVLVVWARRWAKFLRLSRFHGPSAPILSHSLSLSPWKRTEGRTRRVSDGRALRRQKGRRWGLDSIAGPLGWCAIARFM